MTQALAKTILTVKYVNPPKEGSKRGSIKTIDDEFYGVWPETMHVFEPGQTYDVEYSERTSEGRTYRNVKSARLKSLVSAAIPVASVPAASPQLSNAEWRLIVALREIIQESFNAPPR